MLLILLLLPLKPFFFSFYETFILGTENWISYFCIALVIYIYIFDSVKQVFLISGLKVESNNYICVTVSPSVCYILPIYPSYLCKISSFFTDSITTVIFNLDTVIAITVTLTMLYSFIIIVAVSGIGFFFITGVGSFTVLILCFFLNILSFSLLGARCSSVVR